MSAHKSDGTLFTSNLGWFGVSWFEQSLRRVTFGHRTKSDAHAKLISSTTGSTVVVSLSRLSIAQRELVQRLRDYAAGAAADFRDVPLQLHDLTPFQLRVLRGCRQIRWGQTRTYGELAAQAGSPRAARAAGTVMANNRFPIVIPCHRVVAANHSIGGFSAPGGVSMKQRLLELEST